MIDRRGDCVDVTRIERLDRSAAGDFDKRGRFA